jgi:hypothetical protein
MVIRRPPAEVRQALSCAVLAWFIDAGRGRLVAPDLQRQMTACLARRQAQVDSAIKTNEDIRKKKGGTVTVAATGPVTGTPTATASATVLNRIERNRSDLQEGAVSLSEGEAEWSRDYEMAERFLARDNEQTKG